MNDWQDNHHHWEDRMTQSDNHLHERERENINNHLEEQKRIENMLEAHRDPDILDEDEHFKNIKNKRGEDYLEIQKNAYGVNNPYKFQLSPKISKCIAIFVFLMCFFGFFGHYFFGYN